MHKINFSKIKEGLIVSKKASTNYRHIFFARIGDYGTSDKLRANEDQLEFGMAINSRRGYGLSMILV